MRAIMVVRASKSALGSCGSVSACQPTTEKKSLSSGAAASCNRTQFASAPK